MSRWAAVFDGIAGYAAFSDVTFSNNTDLDIWITFNTNQASGIVSNFGVGEYFRYSSGSLRFRSNGNGGLTAWSWTPTLGVQYKLSLRLSPTGVELLIDDVSQGTASGTITNWSINTIALYNTTSFADCEIERLTITDNTTPTNSRDWLNEDVAGSSVNWPDVSGNAGNATLTSTPTDGSQWLLISAGALLIQPSTISSTLIMHSPKILKDLKVTLSPITSTAIVQDPTVLKAKLIQLESITSTSTVQDPVVLKDQLIQLDTISPTSILYTPKVLKGKVIYLDTINNIATIYDPSLLKDKKILLDTITKTSFVYRPTVLGGEIIVDIGGVSFRMQIQWQDLDRL